MAKIKYESGNSKTGEVSEETIFEVENDKVEDCIEAELETAKHELVRNCMDYDYADFPDMDGKRCTEIWTESGNYIRWTEL